MDILETELQKDTVTQEDIYAKNVSFIQKLCRKYFSLGQKSLASNESLAAIDEALAIIEDIRQRQLVIERDVEDKGIEALKENYKGEFSQKLIAEFEAITNEVDRQSAVLINERNQRLLALRSKLAAIPLEAL